LEFYGSINPEESKKQILPRAIYLQIKKKEEGGPFWPRLLKDSRKQPFIRTDFNRWIDEDEEGAERGNQPYFGGDTDFNAFSGNQNFDMDDEDDEDHDHEDEMPSMSSSSEGEQDEKPESSTSNSHEP